MVKRTVNLKDDEPEQKAFDMPSVKEHLFQVTDVYTSEENPFQDGVPSDVAIAKCEVVGGDEEGRTLLNRLSLDETFKGFFACRLFLKAIGEAYKGEGIEIDTDRWIGRQFYATVVHNQNKDKTKTYANIEEYNFDKKVEQVYVPQPKAVKDMTEAEKEQAIKDNVISWDS